MFAARHLSVRLPPRTAGAARMRGARAARRSTVRAPMTPGTCPCRTTALSRSLVRDSLLVFSSLRTLLALFCALQKVNLLIFKRLRTPCKNAPGGGPEKVRKPLREFRRAANSFRIRLLSNRTEQLPWNDTLTRKMGVGLPSSETLTETPEANSPAHAGAGKARCGRLGRAYGGKQVELSRGNFK
jgi:hypothetical protein